MRHIVIGIARRLQVHPAARRWSRAAAVFGFLVCVAFAGVAVTPENRVMTAHIAFTLRAWRITPIIAVLLALASFHSPGLRRRVGMVWLVLATQLGGYVVLLTWGPRPATEEGLVIQVIGQKVPLS